MTLRFTDLGLSVFSTCPPWTGGDRREYIDRLIETSLWSEAAGCTGSLVYTDNRQLDPWVVADLVASHTATLSPLVAVQPVYMHPYAVAKIVASFSFMHDRPICLNLVAGGFKNDLKSLNDATAHDDRYARLIEYGSIVRRLLETGGPLTHEGRFYQTENLTLLPRLGAGLMPGLFVSGSSPAGLAAAERLGATAVRYPRPAHQEPPSPAGEARVRFGIRVGIIARPDAEDAWATARERFPEDRRGRLTHGLAMATSDSQWHRQLSDLARSTDGTPYWLVPFENYKTMCPYLVGSYEEVAAELSRYLALGNRTFILDVPSGRDEFSHIAVAFAAASAHGHTAPGPDHRAGGSPA